MPSNEAGQFFVSVMLHPMSQITQTALNCMFGQVCYITLACLDSWLLFLVVLS